MPSDPGNAQTEVLESLDHFLFSLQADVEARFQYQFERLAKCEQYVTQCQQQQLQLHEKHLQDLQEHHKQELSSVTQDLTSKLNQHRQKLAKEKQHRKDDREWLACLWPEESTLPTVLRPHYQTQPTEREIQYKRLLEQQYRDRKANAVREALAQAQDWLELCDENGEIYFYQQSTGKSCWERPKAMEYQVPEGWDHDKQDWKKGFNLPPELDEEGNLMPLDHHDQMPLKDVSAALKIGKTDYDAIELEQQEQELRDDAPLDKKGHSPEDEENPSPAKNSSKKKHKKIVEDKEDESEDSESDSSNSEDDQEEEEKEDTPEEEVEEEGDDDDDDVSSSDEEVEENPVLLREQMEKLNEEEVYHDAELKRVLQDKRVLAHRLTLASKQEFQQEKDRIDFELAKQAQQDQKRRDKLERTVSTAKAEVEMLLKFVTEANKETEKTKIEKAKKRILSLKSEVKEAVADLQAERKKQKQRKENEKVQHLFTSVSSEERVRYYEPNYDEAQHYAAIEKHTKENELLHTQVFDTHEQTRLELEDRYEQMNTIYQDIKHELATLRETLTEQKTAVLELSHPKDQPRPPTFSPIEDFNPFSILERSEEKREQQEERVQMIMEDAYELQHYNPDDEIEDEDEEYDVDDVDKDTRLVLSQGCSDWEDKSEANRTLIASLATDPDRRQAIFHAVKQELMQREQVKSEYAVEMLDWAEKDRARLELIEQSQNENIELSHRIEKLHRDEIVYENELKFLRTIITLETTAARDLYEQFQDQEELDIKQLIQKTSDEEQILALKDQLIHVQDLLHDAIRLPLQALNDYDAEILTRQSKDQQEQLQHELKAIEDKLEYHHQRKVEFHQLEKALHIKRELALREQQQNQMERTHLLQKQTAIAERVIELHGEIEHMYQQQKFKLFEIKQKEYTWQCEQIQQYREFIVLLYNREMRWKTKLDEQRNLQLKPGIAEKEESDKDARNKKEQWLSEAERVAYEAKLQQLQAQHQEQKQALVNQLNKKQEELDDINLELIQAKAASELIESTDDTVHTTSIETITYLQQQLTRQTQLNTTLQRQCEEQLKALAATQRKYRETFQAEMEKATATTATTSAFTQLLKEQMKEKMEINESLVKSYDSLEKRRADEVVELQTQLNTFLTKYQHLQMWNDSIRLEIQQLHRVVQEKEDEKRHQHQQHIADQRQLRYLIWKQRISAQLILANVEDLFLFFMQGIMHLAGSNAENNTRLQQQGAIPMLAALCNSSSSPYIQMLAAKALGEIGWNRNTPPRHLGWVIKVDWETWVEKKTQQELERLQQKQLEFDSPPDPTDLTEMHFQAEKEEIHPSQQAPILQTKHHWAFRAIKTTTTPHDKNQELLGTCPNVLKVLVDCCNHPDWQVQRAGVDALAIASLYPKNAVLMGRLDGLINTLVKNLRAEDRQVRVNAATGLANLAYENPRNQDRIYEAQGLQALVELCQQEDVEALATAAAALANLCSKNERNAIHVGHLGGIYTLVDLCHNPEIGNVIDPDHLEIVQANASECLVNIMEANDYTNTKIIQERGVEPFILMCGSKFDLVRRHGALVLGNLAQDDENRKSVGDGGGIGALFGLAKFPDEATRLNATWALSNLTWNRDNQDRAGVHMTQLMDLCLNQNKRRMLVVQEHALSVLANILFYNQNNRRRLLDKEHTYISDLLDLCANEATEAAIVDQASRALNAASYEDQITIRLVQLHAIPSLLQISRRPSHVTQQNMVNTLINLCVHDHCKRQMVETGGIERLVELSGILDNEELRERAVAALALLEDIPLQEELQHKRKDIAIHDMIRMCTTENQEIASIAAENLAEEIYHKPHQQLKVLEQNGLEALLEICRKGKDQKTLLPALMAIRNVIHENHLSQDRLAKIGAIKQLLSLISTFHPHDPYIVQASLACLLNGVTDHERNSREVLKVGLDLLITLAEYQGDTTEDIKPPPGYASSHDVDRRWEEEAQTDGTIEANSKLAASILHCIGPYNWIKCQNCGAKETGGSRCSQCGHVIAFVL